MKQLKLGKFSPGASITPRESEALNKYLQEISHIPQITPEEEVILTQARNNGDERAIERLVKANLRFVVSVAKKYQNLWLSLSDLINEWNLWLITAAKRFDETRWFKFISYAVWWIRQSILAAINEQKLIRLPANRGLINNKVYNALISLQQQYEREPTTEELAEFLNLTEVEIESSLVISQKVKSFDAPIGDEADSDSLYEITADPSSNLVATHTDNDFVTQGIRGAVATLLNEKQKQVICLFFGIGGREPLGLDAIWEMLDLTPERVRQIKDKAIINLRKVAGNSMYHFLAKAAWRKKAWAEQPSWVFDLIYEGNETDPLPSLSEQIQQADTMPTLSIEAEIEALDISLLEKKYAIHCLVKKDPFIAAESLADIELMLEVSKTGQKVRDLLFAARKKKNLTLKQNTSHIITSTLKSVSILELNKEFEDPSSATPLRENTITTGDNIAITIPKKQDPTEIGYTINDTNTEKVKSGKITEYFSHTLTHHNTRKKLIVGILKIGEYLHLKDPSIHKSMCYVSAFKKITEISSDNVHYISGELLKLKNEHIAYKAAPDGKQINIPLFSSLVIHRAKAHATPLIEFSLSKEMRQLFQSPHTLYEQKADDIVVNKYNVSSPRTKHAHVPKIQDFLEKHVHQEICYTAGELRQILGMNEMYEGNTGVFITHLLEPAIKEIENNSDLRIELSHRKFHPHATHLIFQIGTKQAPFIPKKYNVSHTDQTAIMAAEERIDKIPAVTASLWEKAVAKHFFAQTNSAILSLMKRDTAFYQYAFTAAKKIKKFLDRKYGNSIVSHGDPAENTSLPEKKEKRHDKKRTTVENPIHIPADNIPVPSETPLSEHTQTITSESPQLIERRKRLDRMSLTGYEKKLAIHLFIQEDPTLTAQIDKRTSWVQGFTKRIEDVLQATSQPGEPGVTISDSLVTDLYALISDTTTESSYDFAKIQQVFWGNFTKEAFTKAIHAINTIKGTHFSYAYSMENEKLLIIVTNHTLTKAERTVSSDDQATLTDASILEDAISSLIIKSEDKKFALHLFVSNNPIAEWLMKDNIVFYESMIKLSHKITHLLREKGVHAYIRPELVGINKLLKKDSAMSQEISIEVVNDTTEKISLIKNLWLAKFNEDAALYFIVGKTPALEVEMYGKTSIAKQLAQQAINQIYDTQKKIIYMIS